MRNADNSRSLLAFAGMSSLLTRVTSDTLYCWRTLNRSPGFSASVLLLLALGIGVNVGFLSLLHRALFLGPSGVDAPDRVARLYFRDPPSATLRLSTTVDANDMRELGAAIRPHGDLAAYATAVGVQIGWRGATTVNATFARHDYFELLGVRPQKGRFFAADEPSFLPGPAILSDRLWRRLGADAAIIGRELEINRERYRVIGIAPPSFNGVDIYASDVWLLLSSKARQVQVLVRQSEKANPAALAGVVTTALRRRAAVQKTADTSISVISGPLQYSRFMEQRPRQVTVLMRLAIVAMAVLLIAAANVGNLLLARGFSRQREFAVRVALGASQARLFALSLAETVLLALVASVVAAAVGYTAQRLLQSQFLSAWQWAPPRFGWGLMSLVFALTALSVVAGGIAPAWKLSQISSSAVFRRSLFDRSPQRSALRGAFVAAQAALTFALMMVGTAVALSLRNVMSIDTGYDTERLTYATVYYGRSFSGAAEAMSAVATRLRARPDVEAVATVTRAPFQGVSFADSLFLPDQTAIPAFRNGPVSWIGVTSDFFRAAGMRVIHGRGFAEEVDRSARHELIVNQNLGDQLWPSNDAVGQCVHFSRAGPCYRVVGVVENARRFDITEQPTPAFLVPLSAVPFPDNPPRAIIVRSAGSRVPAIAAAVRHELEAAFPREDFLIRPLREIIATQEKPWRTSAVLLTVLAGLALVVATLGVYGAVSYSVTRRTRELGVRLALGARIRDLVLGVVGQEMRPVVIGIAAGVAISMWVGRLLASLLYEVSPYSWGLALGVGLILAAAAAVAATLPTLRAARIDPSTVMRAE